jgi:hypothetical protein
VGSCPKAVSINASTLSDLLYLTYPTLISKQQYALLGTPNIADYGAAYDGRHPFLDPNPAVRWEFAQPDDAQKRRQQQSDLMEWWNSEVIKTDPETCFHSLLFYPRTLATPNYRNVYLEPPAIPAGWLIYSLAIFAGSSRYGVAKYASPPPKSIGVKS